VQVLTQQLMHFSKAGFWSQQGLSTTWCLQVLH
jgi:hypothetical protein